MSQQLYGSRPRSHCSSTPLQFLREGVWQWLLYLRQGHTPTIPKHHPITTHSPNTALPLQTGCMDTDNHWVPQDHKDMLAERETDRQHRAGGKHQQGYMGWMARYGHESSWRITVTQS